MLPRSDRLSPPASGLALQGSSVEDLFKSIISPSADPGNPPNKQFPITFADAYIFVLMALYSVPIVAFTQLSSGTDVAYWIGRHGLQVWFVPPLLAWGYFALTHWRIRKKVVVLICIIIPCSLFFILGNIYLHWSSTISAQLLSKDCGSFREKNDLNRAWAAAEQIWDVCIEATARDARINRTEAERITRVHHCPGYLEGYAKWGEQWDYLKRLEEDQKCAGWCDTGHALFTYQQVKDSCALTVGLIMHLSLRRLALQVFAFSGVILIAAVAFIIADPIRGPDW